MTHEVGIEGIDMYKFLLNGIGDLGVWRKRYTFADDNGRNDGTMKTVVRICMFVLLVSLFSCMEDREAREMFERIESVMEENPEAAMAMLDSAREASTGYPRSQRMRYELLKAKAMNKAYVDFTTDSIMSEVVEYYDHHGTANEQMEAHYLLGCVYRDLHESPQALSCYLDATEKADTLSPDCDFATLMRIYGQIADEYNRQCMPYKELEANHQFQKYALMAKDTFNYVVGIELEKRPYYILKDMKKVQGIIEKSCSLFVHYEYNEYVPKAIYPLVSIYVNNNDLTNAAKVIRYFEEESGMFSEDGEIESGHEHYYNTKAQYYEKTGTLDSAEYFYRKLQNQGSEFDMYKGLLSIYEKLGNPDSICKYSILKDQAFEDMYNRLHTQAMYNAEGMFNYVRNQRIAFEKEKEASRNRERIIYLSIASGLLILLSLLMFTRYKRNKKHEYDLLVSQYYANKEEYNKAVNEYKHMEENFEDYKKHKAEEINMLQKKLIEFSSENSRENKEIVMLSIRESNEFANIQKKAKVLPSSHYINISNSEWEEVFALFKRETPAFYTSVVTNHTLSEQEIKVSIFTILQVDTKTTALLLNTTPASISNTKKNISKKLFSSESARSLYSNLAQML